MARSLFRAVSSRGDVKNLGPTSPLRSPPQPAGRTAACLRRRPEGGQARHEEGFPAFSLNRTLVHFVARERPGRVASLHSFTGVPGLSSVVSLCLSVRETVWLCSEEWLARGLRFGSCNQLYVTVRVSREEPPGPSRTHPGQGVGPSTYTQTTFPQLPLAKGRWFIALSPGMDLRCRLRGEPPGRNHWFRTSFMMGLRFTSPSLAPVRERSAHPSRLSTPYVRAADGRPHPAAYAAWLGLLPAPVIVWVIIPGKTRMADRRRAVSTMDVLSASALIADRRRASEYHGCTPARPDSDAIGSNDPRENPPAGRPGGGLEPPGARVEGVRGDTLPVGVAGDTGKSPAIEALSS